MLLNSLANSISQMPMNSGVLNFFQKTAQEGQVALIVPEAAVIAGRSAAAQQRGGFLELQERLIEETVVAFVWLWGVKAFKRILSNHVQKKNGVDTSISWRNVLKKANNSIDLHPDELRSTGSQSIRRLLKYKTGVTTTSVGVTLAIVAFLIPWLNQKKTEWILKNTKYGKKPAASHTPNLQSGAHAAVQPTTGGHFAGGAATPNVAASFPINSFQQALPKAPAGNQTRFDGEPASRPAFSPALNSPLIQPLSLDSAPNRALPPSVQPQHQIQAARQPQFSGVGQALGYAINHTPYGEVLAIDTGITGGRAVVASARSPFEAAEIVFRDAVSLYFYILSAPHLMRLMGSLFDKPFGSSLGLDPQIAGELTAALSKRLPEGEQLTYEAIQKIVNGSNHPALKSAAPLIDGLIRTTSLAQDAPFEQLFRQEARLFENASGVDEALKYLKNMQAGKGAASASDIARLLAAVNEGTGPFSQLGKADRTNLTLAVKNAFRHSSGLTIGGFGEDALRASSRAVSDLLDKLPEAEKQAFIERLSTMAKRDGLDLGTSMFRRSQLLYGQILGNDHALVQQADEMINWMEKAVRRNTTLTALVREEAAEVAEKLSKLKKVKESAQLQQAIERLKAGNLSGLEALETTLAQSGGQTRRIGNWLLAQETLESRIKGLSTISQHADDLTRPDLAERSVLALLDRLEAEATTQVESPVLKEAGGLLQRYGQQIRGFIRGEQGRLFSMYTDKGQALHEAKLAELMQGGIKHDSRLMARALRHKGELVETLKEYFNFGKQKELTHQAEHYLNTALEKFEKTQVDTWQKALGKVKVEKFFKDFHHLSRNMHVFARSIALGGTMLGLGILVPKMQNALTKKLTGKNEHPGIATVSGGEDAASEKTTSAQQHPGASAEPATPAFATGPLTRNNFPAFIRA